MWPGVIYIGLSHGELCKNDFGHFAWGILMAFYDSLDIMSIGRVFDATSSLMFAFANYYFIVK